MTATLLFSAAFLLFSGLLAKRSVRAKLRPLLRRAR